MIFACRVAPCFLMDSPRLAVCSLLLLNAASAWSADNSATEQNAATLDTVIVTGIREGDKSNLAKNVTVIGQEKIAASPATQLVELLSKEANINLRTLTGNDKYGGIDIRGMGATSVSNVLVLVDGVRLNNDDLSGPDLSSVPLSQIERIEIIRSGGSVRYGNGAVGGVVNIITKQRSQNLGVQVSKGSYSTEETRFDYSSGNSLGALAIKANLAKYDSDGYRDNGELKKEDVLLATDYAFNDTWETGVSVKLHRDEFGLPGPVSQELYEGSSDERRSTTAPYDGGDSEDRLARWTLAYTPESNWAADASVYYRERYSETVIGYSSNTRWNDQALSIEDIRYGGDWVVNRLDSLTDTIESDISLGTEFFVTDYQQYRNGRHVADQSKKKIGNLQGIAYFTDWTVKHPDWNVSLGWREDRTELQQDEGKLKRVCDYRNVIVPPFPFPIPVQSNCRNEWTPEAEREDIWKNQALEAGFVYHLTPSLDGFVSYTRSFRNPNLDELLLSAEELLPQQAKHWDAGLRWNRDPMTVDLTWFTITTEDEILYGLDLATGLTVNRNATELTKREGVELDFSYALFDHALTLRANAGYVDAQFEETGAFVPLVPRVNASVGLDWQASEQVMFNVTTHYVGERYDGNDFTNKAYDKLASYTTTDAKLTYQRDKVEVFLSVINLFNEMYSTSGYSGTFYPMPDRNFLAGVKWHY